MRQVLLICCVAAALAQASLLDSSDAVTLDPAELSRIWQEVKTGAAVPQQAGAGWQAAQLEGDEELARVLLLAWLQRVNPLLPMEKHARVYADAVLLHRRALAGHAASCAALAAAYRAGALGELALPASEEKARWYEQRALQMNLLPE